MEVTSPRRGDVYLVDLDPTKGSEIRKRRPCVIVSPDEMNRYLRTVIIAPMTTSGYPYPSRVRCRFDGKDGSVALDQLRAVDAQRLRRRAGQLSPATLRRVFAVLQEMFAP